MQKLFEFNDYKAFLSHLENERAHFARGFRSRLAEEVGCNNTFVSQVLNTGAHFSLEQALKISQYLSLPASEEHYFLLLVEYARAGTPALRAHFKRLLDEHRNKHLNIKDRVKVQTTLSLEDQMTYYSHWYFAAIHMIVTIPGFRTIAEISKALKLSRTLIEKTVSFLLSCGLLVEKNGQLLTGPSYLHLDRSSPHISKHHTNWRMAAINSLQNDEKSDIHYSTVSTLSKKDVEQIQARCVQVIQDYVQAVSQSQEETIYCFTLDFFKLTEG